MLILLIVRYNASVHNAAVHQVSIHVFMTFRYMKDSSNQKTNIKPPDLWIHHDQMELKALEKSSLNGEASTSGVTSNTLPRSGNQEYNQDNIHGNSSSLDKRTYVPSYMGKSCELTRNTLLHYTNQTSQKYSNYITKHSPV